MNEHTDSNQNTIKTIKNSNKKQHTNKQKINIFLMLIMSTILAFLTSKYYITRPVAASNGKKTTTVIQLKTSLTVAPANARLNSSFFVICPMATIVLVVDVPMFAPITIGITSRTVST
jgi:hypothetical protein